MSNWSKNVSDNQMRLARRFEKAGLTSISQAVKAFQRHNNEQIEEWKKQLSEIDAKNGQPWN